MNRIKGNLILLLAATIWGSGFVAQRIGAQHVEPFLFNATRFLAASLVLFPIFIKKGYNIWDRDTIKIFLPGFVLFIASAFQQAGLEYTSAGNAGFITGLYMVLVPLILSLFFKHKILANIWIAVFVSSAGLYFLSIDSSFSMAPGDGLELIGAVFWALHIIIIARFVVDIPVIKLAIGQFFICGLLNLLVAGVSGLDTLSGLSLAWPAILYAGILSIAVGFTLQFYGQTFTKPSDAAIILSLEASFALLFGVLILSENLSSRKLLGVILMFSGMIISQIDFSKMKR
jgi:drug/metabolite transporter (DMT)-like permease